jgi:hypothetical protein
MAQAKLIKERAEFEHKNREFKEIALASMAQDIEIHIKTGRTPVKTGNLKQLVHHSRTTTGYKVESNADYSAVQELGKRSGAREFKNYTTAGTGKGWFKAAIDAVEKNRLSYIEKAKRGARL